jgi:hypothetical protein
LPNVADQFAPLGSLEPTSLNLSVHPIHEFPRAPIRAPVRVVVKLHVPDVLDDESAEASHVFSMISPVT